MTDRRNFVGGLGAMLCGWPAFIRQATAEPMVERGIWRDASDIEALTTVLIVDGYTLGFCVSINEAAQMAEVDLAEPKPGESPVWYQCDGHAVRQRLCFNGALEVHRDGKGHPNRGMRYWTGHGWIDKHSHPIGGPIPGVVKPHVAGEALREDQAVFIRNGRVYGA